MKYALFLSLLTGASVTSQPETLKKLKPASAPVPSGVNYLVQSVPKRYSPF
jgi:hypothetical protein